MYAGYPARLADYPVQQGFPLSSFCNLLTSAYILGYGSKNLTFSFFTVSFCSIQPKS